MADLSSLVKLHQHELDEKRRELKEFYDELEKIELAKQEIIDRVAEEKKLLKNSGGDEIYFSFSAFQDKAKQDIAKADKLISVLEKQIFVVREEMLDIYSEIKKYDMVKKERERIEAELQRLKETKTLDEIAIAGFIRNTKDSN